MSLAEFASGALAAIVLVLLMMLSVTRAELRQERDRYARRLATMDKRYDALMAKVDAWVASEGFTSASDPDIIDLSTGEPEGTTEYDQSPGQSDERSSG